MVPWWNPPAKAARLLQWDRPLQHGQFQHHQLVSFKYFSFSSPFTYHNNHIPHDILITYKEKPIRTQAKWFWKASGESSMGITPARYVSLFPYCCVLLLEPLLVLVLNIVVHYFLSLSRERTGQGGELSPTQVKSCFWISPALFKIGIFSYASSSTLYPCQWVGK